MKMWPQPFAITYNLDRKELSLSLRKHLLASLESVLSEPVFRHFEKQLCLDVFERNLNGKTLFHLEFLPLLDETKPIACKAYFMFAAGMGHIALPDRVQDMRFRFPENLRCGKAICRLWKVYSGL